MKLIFIVFSRSDCSAVDGIVAVTVASDISMLLV